VNPVGQVPKTARKSGSSDGGFMIFMPNIKP
jgi:hypothetical protein